MSNYTDRSSRKAISIDIGGTNTWFGLVDDKGKILAKASIPTAGHGSLERYLESLFKSIRRLTESSGVSPEEIAGIGIGAPCANFETGEIEGATDLPFPSPIPLRALFEKEFGLPTRISNDAKAAAMGEMIFGTARGMKNFILLTLGTGVGGGIVCDGHLMSGRSGFAGELGHVTVSYDRRRPCGCGRFDCLQNYCSSSGIVTTALEVLGNSDRESLLREIPADRLNPRRIYECAKTGDGLALEVFRITGEVLGRACANFAAVTSPEAIIFFGGVANAFDLMEPSIRESMERHLLFLHKDKIRLLKSGLDEADAALLGASALVF